MTVEGPRTELSNIARHVTRLVGLLAGLLVVSSCAAGPEPDTPRASPERYLDSQVGFSIVPPAQWQARPNAGANPVVTFYRTPPDTEGGAPFPDNMVVFVSGTTEGLDENLAAARQQLPEALPNYRPVTDERTQLTDGTPAQLLGGTYVQQGVELRNMQLVVVDAGTSYVATATTPAASFERYRDVVRDSLLTFVPPHG